MQNDTSKQVVPWRSEIVSKGAVYDLISNTPLAYRTDSEHEKLERFADKLCGAVINMSNAGLERSERSEDTLQDFVRRLQDAAAEYLRVTRTRGNGEPTHYLPPANRSVEEIKAAENRLRALLPNVKGEAQT